MRYLTLVIGLALSACQPQPYPSYQGLAVLADRSESVGFSAAGCAVV